MVTDLMKVGILNAISPERSAVNWGGSPIDAYIRFFERLNAPFKYAGYQVAQKQLPQSVDDCDAYVITGSLSGVYDDEPWILALTQFIRDSYQAGKKLVGICFGHQILAHALGGHTVKSEKGWGLGLKSFAIAVAESKGKAWMPNPPDRCALFFAHQDQVMWLPPGAQLLGGNDFCPHAFFSLGDQVLGIQGHPEFSVEIMQDLLALMADRVQSQVYETAVCSLRGGMPDNQLVGQWIVNFLRGRE